MDEVRFKHYPKEYITEINFANVMQTAIGSWGSFSAMQDIEI